VGGLAGIIRFDGGGLEPHLLQGMMSALRHRGGPDRWQTRFSDVDGGASHLAATRTTDDEDGLSVSADGQVALVLDGRLDAPDDVRALLGRMPARTPLDTESALMLAAYEAHGDGFLAQVDGDFALAIWDGRRRTAILARDRFGIRPIFRHFDGRTLSFASDVRAILDLPWVRRTFNDCMVARLIVGFEGETRETFWQGVERVLPGRWQSYGAQGLHEERYWDPARLPSAPIRSEADCIAAYRELLFDSVRRKSRSSHPLACDVSGGLDSSTIAAVTHDLQRRGALPAPSMRYYTLGFEPTETLNDLPYARGFGRFLGLQIEEVAPHMEPLSFYVSKAQRDLEFPGYPNGTAGWGIYRAAGEAGCRVTLSGIGGDEILSAGSMRLAEALQLLEFGEMRDAIRQSVGSDGFQATCETLVRDGILARLPSGMRDRVKAVLRRLMRRTESSAAAILRPDLLSRCRKASEIRSPANVWRSHPPGFMQMSQLLCEPFNVMARELENHAAAGFGLEIRYPFLDRKLVEHCLQVPLRFKDRQGLDKWFHRQALADLLTPEIAGRTDKAEFSAVFEPYDHEVFDLLASLDWSEQLEQWLTIEKPLTVAKLRDVIEPVHEGYTAWMLFCCAALARA
jgi:asparagine synthase (glutamine-hydrolysing)